MSTADDAMNGKTETNRRDADHRPQRQAGRLDGVDTAEAQRASDPALRLAQPPEETVPAKRGPASEAAAGIPAVLKTFEFGFGEMGVVPTLKTLPNMNKKTGFDCPGCAWPSPDGKRHIAEFCENGAKAVSSEATTSRVTPEFFQQWSVEQLAEQSDYWLNQQGRLTHPMILRSGQRHYEPIEWADAFAFIAAELNQLASPDEATFYTSGKVGNEAAFLYQLFVRQFGTNNLPDCSNMCHESSGTALDESIGIGKGTATLEDFELADMIVVIGQNPGTNHPRMMTALLHAKEHGAKMIAINPLPEVSLRRFKNPNPQEYSNPLSWLGDFLGEGAALADLMLQVRINGDLAVLKGIMKEMLEEEQRRPGQVFDHEFIRLHTAGFEDFIADLTRTSWEEIVEGSGLPLDQIREAGQMIAKAKRVICCWAMGLTQHKNGVETIRQVINLLLLGGHIGRPGGGACCVRGHSNVQGDRTMGIWERVPPEFLDALQSEFHFDPPRKNGLDVVKSINAMHAGEVKVFFGLGGNFLSATPDTTYTAEAMRQCRLTVQVSTKLNRGHLITGKQALILPCLGRSEKDRGPKGERFVTVEDSMGVISASRGVLEPASDGLLSEPAIVAGLAKATLGGKGIVNWEALGADYDLIRDHIARTIPGFENFNERIRQNIFYLPNGARTRDFKTDTGKANFIAAPIPQHNLAAGEFLMTTIRSHDQFNTTIYGMDDRYRGIYGGRRVVFLNADDIRGAGLSTGQLVDLISLFEGEERVAHHFQVVPYQIPRRCAATYYPETNVLVPIRSVADKSNQPVCKSVRITLRPSMPQGSARQQKGGG
ncbi:MAG: FdhF/YdeP family oxidoreductase [Nitrospira sp.]|nr:FdhF/YdeP family oxidoreductase [Nitrospira sp.]MBP6604478.1 FdhF/YdeP family oxidoreductase [Nitrospira sp.]HQY58901.1 FdhF/YdeP family oxidoreductase [Nitrospira sp.]HRA96393.1 FdhF/YdeP family oxidoreductase [Nitrospira sp.]